MIRRTYINFQVQLGKRGNSSAVLRRHVTEGCRWLGGSECSNMMLLRQLNECELAYCPRIVRYEQLQRQPSAVCYCNGRLKADHNFPSLHTCDVFRDVQPSARNRITSNKVCYKPATRSCSGCVSDGNSLQF